jgi:acyl-homoserine lactone synthase
MIDVHVVASNNRDLYGPELDSFFAWRHRIYVGERGWRDPSPDERERDQFDTEAAVYLLALEDGELVAGSRLIPTSEPHLLSEVFPQLGSVRGLPREPDVAEWTRMFVVPSRRDRSARGVTGQMCCAVMEYAYQEGLSELGGVQEIYHLGRWEEYGWRVRPLGLPEVIDGSWSIAAYFAVDEEAVAGARRASGVDGSLLVRRGSPSPFVYGESRLLRLAS